MSLGERIRARAKELGISQSELARRADVPQSTINTLINGDARWSPHLLKIARALRTTPDYLTGEVDDPEANAPPTPAPVIAHRIMMPVTLPSEKALTRMFDAFFLALDPAVSHQERAQTFARWLPIGLAQLQDLLPDPEAHEAAASTRREMAEAGAIPRRGAR